MAYIYKITNQINNKIYIGKTEKTIEERFREHVKKAKIYPNRYLYDAMNHYGYDNFKIEIIEKCDISILNQREKYWIAHYNSTNHDIGYNLTEGGDGGNTWQNNPHKIETGDKIRQSALGNKYIPLSKENLEKDIIDLKLTTEQLKEKYHCSGTTLRNRIKEIFGKNLPELREIHNSGQFKKIEIDKDSFYQDIINAKLSNREIAKKYNISEHTVVNRSNEWFGASPGKLRGKQVLKKAIITDYNILNKMILNNFTLQEIAEYFNMSKNTLIARLKEEFNMNFKEYREYVKSKN